MLYNIVYTHKFEQTHPKDFSSILHIFLSDFVFLYAFFPLNRCHQIKFIIISPNYDKLDAPRYQHFPQERTTTKRKFFCNFDWYQFNWFVCVFFFSTRNGLNIISNLSALTMFRTKNTICVLANKCTTSSS